MHIFLHFFILDNLIFLIRLTNVFLSIYSNFETFCEIPEHFSFITSRWLFQDDVWQEIFDSGAKLIKPRQTVLNFNFPNKSSLKKISRIKTLTLNPIIIFWIDHLLNMVTWSVSVLLLLPQEFSTFFGLEKLSAPQKRIIAAQAPRSLGPKILRLKFLIFEKIYLVIQQNFRYLRQYDN